MIKDLRTTPVCDPACQKRSDSDHLRFVILEDGNSLKFDFTLELNGTKSWTVPEGPSMNPMDHRSARYERIDNDILLETNIQEENNVKTWDKGNYIPIDDNGKMLNEFEAMKCLKEGVLKFFLQGSKLVGEFVLMKKDKRSWLLMKRHDEFASYNEFNFAGA